MELSPTGQIRYRSPLNRVIGPALVPPQSFDSPLPAIDEFDDLDVGASIEQSQKQKKRTRQKQKQEATFLEKQIEVPLRGLFSVLVERKSQLRIKEESPENLNYIARRERQRRVENESVNDEIKRYREMSEQMARVGAGANLPAVRKLLTSFYEPLMVGIEREQSMISEGVPGIDRRVYGPYLQLLGADKIAVISLHTMISMLMRGEEKRKLEVFSDREGEHGQAGSVKFIRLASSLGKAIEAEVNLSRLQMREKLLSARYRAGLINMEDLIETFNQERYEGENEMIADREREEKIANIDREIREKNLLKESDMLNTIYRGGSTKKLKTVRAVSEQAKKALDNADWGPILHLKVGAAIIAIVLDVCKIKVPGPETVETGEKIEVPAFYHDYSLEPNAYQGWKQKASPNNRWGTVHWHDSFFRFVHSATLARARSAITKHKPMIVAPRPWESYNEGGYLNSNSVVMRGKYSRDGPSDAQMKLLAERVGEYDNVFGALNVLGATAWMINTDILEVVEQVWREKKYAGGFGGGIANVPPRAELNLPNWPSSEFRLRRERNGPLYATALPSAKEVGEFMRVLNRTKQTNRELHSQRCDFAIKIEVAREMRNEERIYFPHNVDFRGRAYTMHAHLNHIGSDFCRGILKFADAKPLGRNGLDWLFIQCANLYGSGADKLPLHQRVEFGKLNLENIKKSAEDPLGPDGSWWQDADDPWQCLATCMEITKATNSKDPAKFMCNLPIHQDGSCNGLQHYAALGRDFAGGQAVNLVPADRGADVYTGIANVLRGIVQKDIENCDYKDEQSVERMKLAKLLIDQVDRKLVKQTVMTSVYGVTFVGARMQIQARLKERVGFENESVRYRVAAYAAKRTLDALNDMFQNAREVMEWLTHCASVVTKVNAPVQWTTPLGLPVLQPYRNKTQKSVRTLLQTFVLRSEDEKQKVNKSKQRSAFPPNYIHSIDSTHMMMTALECSRANITFAGVHDSFWTHAGDVPVMSRILREKFIELHKAPLLDNLYEELKSTYPEVAGEFLPPPEYGDLDIETVRDSTYFFS